MSKHRRADADAAIADLLRGNPDLAQYNPGLVAEARAAIASASPLPRAPLALGATGAVPTPPRATQSVILPVAPSANRYWRHYRGRVVVSAEAQAYKAQAAAIAHAAGMTPMAGPVAVRLHVYRERRAGDLDNKIKVCLDALRGIAYADDDQIVEIHAWRHDDKAQPRVEVEIRQANG